MQKNKNYLSIFFSEVDDQLSGIITNYNQLKENPENKDAINVIFRYIHTVKGNSGTCGLKNISKLAHSIENIFGALRDDKLNFSNDAAKLIENGLAILSENLEHIKNDPDFDDNLNFDDYASQVEALLTNKPQTQQAPKIKISNKIIFTKDEVENLRKKYKTYLFGKATIIFQTSDLFADIKMFQFLLFLESKNFEIIKMIPEQEHIGQEYFSADMCNHKIEIIFPPDKNSELIINQGLEFHSPSIENSSIEKNDIRNFLDKKKKSKQMLNLPEKFLYTIILKIGEVKIGILCLNIIYIVNFNPNVFIYTGENSIGLFRYLDKIVPIVNLSKTYKVTDFDKILLIDTANGVLGVLFTEILDIKRTAISEILIDFSTNNIIFLHNTEKINIIDGNKLLDYKNEI